MEHVERTEIQINAGLTQEQFEEAVAALSQVIVIAAGRSLVPISTSDPLCFMVCTERRGLETAAELRCPELVASLRFGFFDPER